MGERERQARESIGALDGFASPGPGTRSVLLPGCQASLTDPDLVRDALTVLGALLPEPPAPCMDACCGLPYLHAGDVTGFERSARRLIASTSRFDTLVVLDPGCAYTIERLYPRYGLETRVEVLTLVEAVLPHLDRFVRRTNPRGPVFYHDPCHLGRGLGIYDAPREILLRLVAGGARDLHTSREREPCCGGGGAIPLSMGRVAQDAADRLAATMIAQGARTVVTACPTCTRMLSGRDDLACSDIVSLMAGAL
jgi:Fe-S oxidoreductase